MKSSPINKTSEKRITAPPGIEITRLDEDRWQDYRALRLEALQEATIAFGSSYEEEMFLSEDAWKKRMKNALFAVVEGNPAGILVLVFNHRAKTKHIAEIFSFYVKKDYRGTGIGKLLMETTLAEIGGQKDVIKVRLSVNPEQEAAMRLYRKYGFKTVGHLKKELNIDGRFHDELIMEKFV